MHSTWWINILATLAVLGELGILCVIIRRRLLRNWGSVWALCAVSFSCHLCLWAVHRNYTAYFYLFWALIAMQAILRLWVLADCLRAVPGLKILPREIYRVVALCGFLFGGIAFLSTAGAGARTTSHILKAVLVFDRCVNLAWGGFLGTIFLMLILLGIGWTAQAARVANGVIVSIASGIVGGYMMSFGRHAVRTAGNGLESASYLIVLAIWTYAFVHDDRQIACADFDVHRLVTPLYLPPKPGYAQRNKLIP